MHEYTNFGQLYIWKKKKKFYIWRPVEINYLFRILVMIYLEFKVKVAI